MLADWSFGLVPIPTCARHNEQLRKNIFAMRARVAQEVQDKVQEFLRADSQELEERRDAILSDLDPLFSTEQLQEGQRNRDEHSDKHLEVLTMNLSHRREMLLLNQPTENEAVTMKPDNIFPQTVKKSEWTGTNKGNPHDRVEATLMDYSDDDEDDRRSQPSKNSEIKNRNAAMYKPKNPSRDSRRKTVDQQRHYSGTTNLDRLKPLTANDSGQNTLELAMQATPPDTLTEDSPADNLDRARGPLRLTRQGGTRHTRP